MVVKIEFLEERIDNGVNVIKIDSDSDIAKEKELDNLEIYRDENAIYVVINNDKDFMKAGSKLYDFIVQNKIYNLNIDKNLAKKEFILGFVLTSYEFDKYKSKKRELVIKIHIEGLDKKDLEYIDILKESVFLARDLANERPINLNPSTFVREIEKLFRDLPVNIIVFDHEELKNRGFGGIYNVGKGSTHPPKLLVIEYLPNKDEKPIALVGKGVCFDAGGIHLKPTGYIEDMHIDMHGAASVIASLYGYIKLVQKGFAKPKNIVVLTPLVENIPSDKSLKPSDIIKHYNGKTTEVVNTDAEGRLILADALAYASEHYKPKLIIDLATLTGAQIVALGENVAAIMGNNKELINNLINIGKEVNEYLWELPLLDYKDVYLEMVKGDVSDLKNIPSPRNREAGALVGGAFLWNFVPDDIPWAHLDIAGPAIHSKKWFWVPKGGTGFGVLLLVRFLERFDDDVTRI